MSLKLNNIPISVFEVNSSAQGETLQRQEVVAGGRLLMADRNGKDLNALKVLNKQGNEYNAKLTDEQYANLNKNTQENMMMFAANLANASVGKEPLENYEAFLKNQRNFMKNKTFLTTLQGIIQDIVTPVLPSTMTNGLDWLCESVSVPLGQTYEIDVASNDIIMFEDDSWGASRSKPAQTLYSHPITLNPKLRTGKVSLKWYQLAGNNADLGRFFNSLSAGMYSKIVAMWNAAMVKGSTSTFYTPQGLSFDSNTSANWTSLVKKVSSVNGTSFRNVLAVGDLSALSQALPSGVVNNSTINLDAALSTMLGIEWAKYGYLAEYMGARCMPIENIIQPGTQNTTVTEQLPTDVIYFISSVGYKPVYVGIEEGTPITIELDPSQTADMTIDITVSISIDAQPVFASKVGRLEV